MHVLTAHTHCPPPPPPHPSPRIYAGLGDDSAFEIFRVQETSDNFSRYMCQPCHPLKLEVKSHFGVPRAPGQSAEANDLHRGAFKAGCGGFCGSMNGPGRAAYIQHMVQEDHIYNAQPTLFTGIRNGYRCLCCRSFKNGCCCCKDNGYDGVLDSAANYPDNDKLQGEQRCVGCCGWSGCCLDGMTTVAGKTNEQSTLMLGAVPEDALPRVIGSADEVCTMCTPTISLGDGPAPAKMHRGAPADSARVTGPCFWGGWSGMCCDAKWKVGTKQKLQDIGVILKKKPKGMAQALREMVTDSDTYTLEFTNPNLTPEKKASVLTSVLLLDFMLFENDNDDMCGIDSNGKAFVNLCNTYCCGMVCPIRLTAPDQGSEDASEG